MSYRLITLSIWCGILIAFPLVTTPTAPINWLQQGANSAKSYFEKGIEPMKKVALCYAALTLTARITSEISKIGRKTYADGHFRTYTQSPLEHIMPSQNDRNLWKYYLKAVPWTIGFTSILGYICDRWGKRK
jgi:hypothetical protein